MTEVPRGLEIVAHDDRDQPPLGRKWISPKKTNERQGHYLSQVVAGERPLDEHAADVVRAYLEAHHAKQ
jgi:hypothetical protein